MTGNVEFVRVDTGTGEYILEYQWIASPGSGAPLVIFLHEGLGSRSMWKDFPARFCSATGCRGLVYSRPGYGESTPRAIGEKWGVDFMHRQAYQVLPALIEALEIDSIAEPPILFGHSDGGSIALLYAGRFIDRVKGVIALAPHLFVEDISVASIEQARRTYLETNLPQKLGRYHHDPDSAFWGWNDIWLDPAFRAWNIEAETARVEAPVLAIQGLDDEYGTLEQVRGISRLRPGTTVVELPDCGHSPHRDQPAAVIGAAVAFLERLGMDLPAGAAL